MKMKRKEAIAQYRAAHRDAIEHYDFDRAKLIMAEIKKLSSIDVKKERKMDLIHQEFDLIQNVKQRKQSNYVLKSQEIKSRYQNSLDMILYQHENRVKKLREERKIALERERNRPVHEADDLLLRAKYLGQAQQYENAKILYAEACYIREMTKKKRIEACKRLFREHLQKLKEKKESELKILLDKMINSYQQLEVRRFHDDIVMENKERAWKSKAGYVPDFVSSYDTVRPPNLDFSLPRKRRSASVTRKKRNSSNHLVSNFAQI